MTDTTMQLLSQGTDPVKMPDFDILAEGKTLSGVAERLMSLSLTDNRGFEADQLTITLARGRAELYPEMHGTVTGFKSEIDNQDWIIAKAEHTIDNSGFTTQLELEAKIPEWIAETE